jgi:anti-anti-sigma factor
VNYTHHYGGTPDSQATVNVDLSVERSHGYMAILEVCGEHDMATAQDIVLALRGLHGNVLVDLSECTFIDSTVIRALLDDLRARSREGQRLDLIVPPLNTQIRRTLQVSGIQELLSVYDSRPTSVTASST